MLWDHLLTFNFRFFSMFSQKKKGFTLFELLIVVFVLAILIGSGIYGISTAGADKFYAESCVNTLYGPLSNWIYSASVGKVISWDVVPDAYLIKVNSQKSGFGLYYTWNAGEIADSVFSLPDISYCQKGAKYRVQATFDFSEIRMLPSLRPSGIENWFTIYSGLDSLATWAIVLKFCSPAAETDCHDFWEIVFDARIGAVRKRFCKRYLPKDGSTSENGKTCKERTTGF